MVSDEIKMNIYEYNKTIYNLNSVRIPSSSINSYETYKDQLNNYCENTYKDPEFASQEYNLNFLKNIFKSFFTCLTSLKNILNSERSDTIEMCILNTSKKRNGENQVMDTYLEVPDIINDIKDILLDKKKVNKKQGYNYFCFLMKSEETKYREEIIEKISKKIKNIDKENVFYNCILELKNGVTEMNEKIGKYTTEYISKIKNDETSTIQLTENNKKFLSRKKISFNNSTNLSTTQKKQLLEIEDIQFLQHLAYLKIKDNYFILDNEAKKYYNDFTKIEYIDNLKHPTSQKEECKAYIMSKSKFKSTKLSYMIYPSSSDNDLQTYIKKRNLMVKYFRIFSKHDNNKIDNNHIYEKYEAENNRITQNYFDKLKTCRAISGEVYESYVLRLKTIGCIPLPLSLWVVEVIALKVVK
uniref:Uncharacterized protein n=1 Tax=Schizaphis graminum TaxID=13262 RepID=A0A2S2N9L5_SCHGA